MITSKQRAKLKGIAMNIDTIFQIGKGGISDNLIKQVEAREIIKLRVLENCMEYSPREAGNILAEKTNSELVQTIGSKIVLYRRNEKNPVIELK